MKTSICEDQVVHHTVCMNHLLLRVMKKSEQKLKIPQLRKQQGVFLQPQTLLRDEGVILVL